MQVTAWMKLDNTTLSIKAMYCAILFIGNIQSQQLPSGLKAD